MGCLSSLPFFSNSLTLHVNPTDQAFHASPLSGPIDDYTVKEGKNKTIDITEKLLYLECFQKQTKQTKSVMDKLVEVETTLARLEAAEAKWNQKASDLLSKVQIYTKLLVKVYGSCYSKCVATLTTNDQLPRASAGHRSLGGSRGT